MTYSLLQKPASDTILKEKEKLELSSKSNKESQPDCISKFVQEVHVAIISSPEYNIKADYSEDLKNYFRKPKLLAKDDIFCVVLNGMTLQCLSLKMSYISTLVYYCSVCC